MDFPSAKVKTFADQLPYRQREDVVDHERELSGLAAAYRIIFPELTEEPEESPAPRRAGA